MNRRMLIASALSAVATDAMAHRGRGVGIPVVYTTWNPSDKVAMTLTNGNLTATNTASPSGVRAVKGQTAGQYYWEVTMATWVQGSTAVGFGLSTAALNAGTLAGWGIVSKTTGSIIINNIGSGSSLGARASGNIIGIALDIDNQLCWFRVAPAGNWNGSGTASPGGTGGVSISTIAGTQFPCFLGSNLNEQAIANFGASAFSGAVPSGFTAGWPG